MAAIQENMEELEVTDEQAMMLVGKGLIYRCPDCGESVYHIETGLRWDEVEKELKDKAKEAGVGEEGEDCGSRRRAELGPL